MPGKPECAVDPHLSWQVTNNQFTCVQRHPNLAGSDPTAVEHATSATTVTYTATIAPDGIIAGTSGDMNGIISGEVSGAHMSGRIEGLLCGYTFNADRS